MSIGTGIELATTFSGSGQIAGSPLAEQIAALPNLFFWGQPEAGYITDNGSVIQTFADRKGSARTFTQGTSGDRAALVTDTINGKSMSLARFVAGSPSDRYAMTDDFITSASYSLAMVFEPGIGGNNTGNLHGLLGRFTSGTTRDMLAIDQAGRVYFYRGSNNQFVTLRPGERMAVIAAFNSGDSLVKLWADGVRVADQAAAGSATTSTDSVLLGSSTAGGGNDTVGFTGDLFDLMMFEGEDVFATGNDALLKKYFATVYGAAE